MNRGPVAEISLSALEHNINILKDFTKSRQIIAVVKADAYGHGAVEISKKMVKEGISFLAVAYTGEARALRDAGVKSRIMVLFDCTEIGDYFDYGLIPVVHDVRTAAAFSVEALKRGITISVHVKIDTGMGRVGLNALTAVSEIIQISSMSNVSIEGLLSHFSEADLSDRSFALHQLDIFCRIKSEVSEKLNRSFFSHIANSAAVLSFKESLLDAVRPGLMLYGYSPLNDGFGLKPVMKVKTKILDLRNVYSGSPISYGRKFITRRNSRIAVLPVGYADGYNRLFSNNATVLVNGKRAPVVGRVCMDVTMIDVTDIREAAEGDEVVLLGGQDNEAVTAQELSKRINTIPYDILTSLGNRSRKEYST